MAENDSYIWAVLYNAIGNENGVAGLMGNLQAESGLVSYRLQGDFTLDYTKSVDYTNKVNSGEITRDQFINDAKGYGLAQWTYYTRKEALYDAWQASGYASIGDVRLQVAFLIDELRTSYPSVYNTLVTTPDILTASNDVLFNFENPQQQGPDVQLVRYNLSVALYNALATGEPVPIPVPDPVNPPTIVTWVAGAVADLMRRGVIYKH